MIIHVTGLSIFGRKVAITLYWNALLYFGDSSAVYFRRKLLQGHDFSSQDAYV